MRSVESSVVFPDVSWPQQRWFRSNILLDTAGQSAGADGTSQSLTRGRDRLLLRSLRADAHAIVTGGETVRREGWHFPPHGFLFVASNGDLPMAECAHPERVKVFSFEPDPPNALTDALSTLVTEFQVRRLLCESGPLLLRALVDADLLDEAFVSLVPARDVQGLDPHHLENAAREALGMTPARYVLHEQVTEPDIAFLRFARVGTKPSSVFR